MEAVEFYLPHLKAQNQTCSVEDLVAEMLRVKQADGASRRYLNDIRSRLGQFAETFTGRATSDVAGDEVDDWLRDLKGRKGQSISAVGRNNFRRLLIVAFNYAVSRGYCADNPAVTSAKAKEIEGTVGILSVKQTADLLAKADSELVPFLAIGAFAGLRRAELERLDWSEVDLAGGLIEVVASNAKSARRRFVKIRKNLKAWLNPYAIRSGNVTPKDFRQRLDDARVAATIGDWPNNALRHGFASYTLAAENDAAALALELGHTNSNLVFQHYRQIVKPKDAKAYWNITPSAEASGKVVAYLAC